MNKSIRLRRLGSALSACGMSSQSCTGAYAAEKRSKTAIWTIAIWLCIRTIYRYCSVSSKTKGIIHSQLLRDEIGDNAMEIKKLY